MVVDGSARALGLGLAGSDDDGRGWERVGQGVDSLE